MSEIYDKNISPVGWYIATEILRFVPSGVDPDDPSKRYLVWENLKLVRADNPETAYQKAIESGELNERERIGGVVDCEGRTKRIPDGRWIFEGLAGLLAIYEDFEDGAEVMWIEHPRKSAHVAKRMVRAKDELEVFCQ